MAILVIAGLIGSRFRGKVNNETSTPPASEEKGQAIRSNDINQSNANNEEEKKTKQAEERRLTDQQDRIDRQEREAEFLWKRIAQLDWRGLGMPKEDRGGYAREIKELCNQIIDAYPDCSTADKARRKLKEIEERE